MTDELEPAMFTGLKCVSCGDTVTPDYPDVADEMNGDACHECGVGTLRKTKVPHLRVSVVRRLLDQRIEHMQNYMDSVTERYEDDTDPVDYGDWHRAMQDKEERIRELRHLKRELDQLDCEAGDA